MPPRCRPLSGSALLKPLSLNAQDKEGLKAFLEALNEPRTMVRAPKLPE